MTYVYSWSREYLHKGKYAIDTTLGGYYIEKTTIVARGKIFFIGYQGGEIWVFIENFQASGEIQGVLLVIFGI